MTNQYNRPPDPTPDEIREACLLIQDTWSPKTEAARRMIQNTSPDMSVPKTVVVVERHRMEPR